MQGTVAGVGDLVQARRNAWHLEGWNGNPTAPINRTTYRVLATHAGGGLTVARLTGRDEHGAEQLDEPIRLPAAYVNQHVTLAYASTVHAAHGRTVDTAYPVLGPGTDAASAYVQLTRVGRRTWRSWSPAGSPTTRTPGKPTPSDPAPPPTCWPTSSGHRSGTRTAPR
jgi:hypothetical protein